MKYLIEVEEKITRCLDCPFLSSGDECLLQDEYQNAESETFDDQFSKCPLTEVEEWTHQ